MTLKWYSSMSTGLVSVDRQHMRLFDLFNTLVEALRQGGGRDDLQRRLADLTRHAAEHFAQEECCMQQYRCPAAAQNKAAHAQFIGTLGEFQQRLAHDGPTANLILDFENFLAQWARQHIAQIDRQLAPCARKLAS